MNTDFAQVLKTIISTYGIEILKDDARFLALFLDMAPKLNTEKKMLKRIKDGGMLVRFYKIATTEEFAQQSMILSLDNDLRIQLGFSDEWSYSAISAFCDACSITMPELITQKHKGMDVKQHPNAGPTERKCSPPTSTLDSTVQPPKNKLKNRLIIAATVVVAIVFIAVIFGNGGKNESEIRIEDLCNYEGEYTCGNSKYTYVYRLPFVDGPHTNYLTDINAKMESYKVGLVAEELRNMEFGCSLISIDIHYEYEQYKEITSLRVSLSNDWGQNFYNFYNFDSKGEKVPNAQIFKMCGISSMQFVERAKELLTEMSKSYNNSNEYLEMTIAPENCNENLPMCIIDGELCFVGTVCCEAGAGAYDELFKTGFFVE